MGELLDRLSIHHNLYRVKERKRDRKLYLMLSINRGRDVKRFHELGAFQLVGRFGSLINQFEDVLDRGNLDREKTKKVEKEKAHALEMGSQADEAEDAQDQAAEGLVYFPFCDI